MSLPRDVYRGTFWTKVAKGESHECWPWLGYKRPSGHGLTSLDSLMIHASRKAWILTYGPIRGGLCVNHRCDNAACCNPAHLYLGTRADNMIDRFGPPGEKCWTGSVVTSRSTVRRQRARSLQPSYAVHQTTSRNM